MSYDYRKDEFLLARKFVTKHNNAKAKGIKFTMTIQSLRNLLRATKCYYTGIPLTKENFTIDRVDSAKGYEKGNVVACCEQYNMWKGTLENPTNSLDMELCFQTLLKTRKRLGRKL